VDKAGVAVEQGGIREVSFVAEDNDGRKEDD
jgi:hypothetical protein